MERNPADKSNLCSWHACIKCYIHTCVHVGRLVNLISISLKLNILPHVCLCVRGVAIEINLWQPAH